MSAEPALDIELNKAKAEIHKLKEENEILKKEFIQLNDVLMEFELRLALIVDISSKKFHSPEASLNSDKETPLFVGPLLKDS